MSTHRYKQEAAGLHGRLRAANIEHDSLQDEVACLHAQRDTLLAACEATIAVSKEADGRQIEYPVAKALVRASRLAQEAIRRSEGKEQ